MHFQFKLEPGGAGLVSKLCPTLLTPWWVALQAPLFMGFPRQELWSELPFLLQRILQIQGLNSHLQYCRRILYRLNHQGSPITRTWYFIKVQLRLVMIIFGFISIVLTHALVSRGSNNGQPVTCGRNEVTQFGKKHRMSRKAA